MSNEKDYVEVKDPSGAYFQLSEQPKYKCKTHGDITQNTLMVDFDDETKGRFCLKCLVEFLKETIGEAVEVKEDEG